MKKTEAETGQPKPERPTLVQGWRQIWHKHQVLGFAMLALVVFSLVFLVFSLFRLNPRASVVIVGYGDVYGDVLGVSGGYRRASWVNMLAFPCLALLFGVLHNILAVRLFQKYGKDVALVFVGLTMVLLFSAFVVLLRLLGEG